MSDTASAASSGSLRAPGFAASASASTASTNTAAAPAANIRVYVRVRPLNSKEHSESSQQRCLSPHPAQALIEFHSKPEPKQFRFDHVSPTAVELAQDCTAGQIDVFNKVGKPITDAAIKGYNGTICQ